MYLVSVVSLSIHRSHILRFQFVCLRVISFILSLFAVRRPPRIIPLKPKLIRSRIARTAFAHASHVTSGENTVIPVNEKAR